MITKKTLAATFTILTSGALLAGCGSSDYDAVWTGNATPADTSKGAPAAEITLDGGDCSWTVTEVDGKKDDAKCERDGEDFKFQDPKTGRDLKFSSQLNGDTLTLTPDNGEAEGFGTMVLTRAAS